MKKEVGKGKMAIIRKATIRDTPKIIRLWEALMQHHRVELGYGKGIFEFRKDMTKIYARFLKRQIRSKKAAVFVADTGAKNGNLAGHIMVAVQKRPPIYVHDSEAYIGELFVDADHRREGIATALMKEALGWAKTKKAYSMSIMLSSKNSRALATYKKSGFFVHHFKMNKIIK